MLALARRSSNSSSRSWVRRAPPPPVEPPPSPGAPLPATVEALPPHLRELGLRLFGSRERLARALDNMGPPWDVSMSIPGGAPLRMRLVQVGPRLRGRAAPARGASAVRVPACMQAASVLATRGRG